MDRRSLIKSGFFGLATILTGKARANIETIPEPIAPPIDTPEPDQGKLLVSSGHGAYWADPDELSFMPDNHWEAFDKAGLHFVIAPDADIMARFVSKGHYHVGMKLPDVFKMTKLLENAKNRKLFLVIEKDFLSLEFVAVLRKWSAIAHENNLSITLGKEKRMGFHRRAMFFLCDTITVIEKMDQDGWMLCKNHKSRFLPSGDQFIA